MSHKKRYIFWLALNFYFFLSACLYSQTFSHSWIRTNPGGGGAFSTIGAGPSGIIIAGSDLSGAYRSLDGGKGWDAIGVNRGIFETHISGIGFDPFNEKVIFIGTEKGIYRSKDGGNSYVKVYDTGYITDIEVSRSNPSVVYAAYRTQYNKLSSRVLRSEDGGEAWPFFHTNFPSGRAILKLLCDPQNENIVYALTGKSRFVCGPAEVYKSTNKGENWVRLASDVGSIMDIAIDRNNPAILYFTTYSATCSNSWGWTNMSGKLYRTMDQGETLEFLTNRTGIIFLDPDSGKVMRLLDPREINSWREDAGTWTSVDSGHTFIQTGFIENWDCGYNGIYDPDLSTHKTYGVSFNGIAQTLGTDLSNPNVILWTNSQFSFRSVDNGTTFQNTFTREVKPGWWQSTGFDNIDPLYLVIHPSNPNIIYIGSFDIGIWRSLDHGESWQSCNHPNYTGDWEGYGGNTIAITIDPERENVVWSTNSGNQEGESPTYLLRSNDYGERMSWIKSNSGLPTKEVMGLSLDPTSPVNNRTLFVTADGDVYRSTDDGYSWSSVKDNGGLRFTAIDHFEGNWVYAGGGAGLWRSEDGGNTWEESGLPEMRGNNDFWGSGGQGVFDIHPDVHKKGRVYVTVFGKDKGLWRSNNAGQTWTKLWTDDYMRRVAVSPLDSNIIYATSSSAFTHGGYDSNSNGVIFSFDGGKTWKSANDQMAWPFAICVKLDSTGTVFVGSPGTGFQKAHVPDMTYIEKRQINTFTGIKLSAYPNPFNLSTKIEYEISTTQNVNISIYSLLGEKVKTLASKIQPAGIYAVKWDGKSDNNKLVCSGIYILRLRSGYKYLEKKIVFIK